MAHSARTLPVQSAPRVGIVVGKYDSQYYGQILDSAIRELERFGYSVISRSTAASALTVQEVWESLLQADCQGVILNSKGLTDDALRQMIIANPNIVLMNRYLDTIPLQCVHLDNVFGAQLAVRHLIDMGHRNIAMITGPVDYAEVVDRSVGFKREMQKNQLTVSEDLIANGDFTSDGGAEAFRQLLRSASSFSAIFVQNDNMAAGVIEACQAEGITTPNEISIVGFDDVFTARITTPKLTTVKQPTTDAGIRAAKILHKLISNDPQYLQTHSTLGTLKPELILRDSVFNIKNMTASTRQKNILTPRENECLQWISVGRSSNEIANILGISEDTVNFHLRNVIRKLNARNRTHAVAIAFSNGLASLENMEVTT